MGNLSSAFGKPSANGHKYSRAGTIGSLTTQQNSAKKSDMYYFFALKMSKMTAHKRTILNI
jgi:hypothetical protein